MMMRVQPPSALREVRARDLLHDGLERRRRHGQVKERVAARVVFFGELFQQLGQPRKAFAFGRILGDGVDARAELLLELLVLRGIGSEFGGGLKDRRAEFVVVCLAAHHADDECVVREAAIAREIHQRGKQLAMREVAAGTEDDDAAGLGRTFGLKAFAERIWHLLTLKC